MLATEFQGPPPGPPYPCPILRNLSDYFVDCCLKKRSFLPCEIMGTNNEYMFFPLKQSNLKIFHKGSACTIQTIVFDARKGGRYNPCFFNSNSFFFFTNFFDGGVFLHFQRQQILTLELFLGYFETEEFSSVVQKFIQFIHNFELLEILVANFPNFFRSKEKENYFSMKVPNLTFCRKCVQPKLY